MVQSEHVEAVDSHGGEGFVDLNDVDIIFGQLELGQELWDGDRRSDAHNAGWDACDGGTDKLGEDGLAELDGFGALHEKNSCG